MDGRLLNVREILPCLIEKGCEDASPQLDQSSVSRTPASRVYRIQYYSFDVYRGRLEIGRQLVSINVGRRELPIFATMGGLKKLKDIANKLSAWSKWKHSNVLELIGVTKQLGRLAIVSPWVDYFTIPEFLRAHPQCDRYSLCTQIAYGVAYLHSKGFVHGCIAGANINVMNDHTPKIAGFEYDLPYPLGTLPRQDPLVLFLRSKAPEVLMSETMISKAFRADVYSLAMTIFETTTGTAPYDSYSIMRAMIKAVQGQHPERPTACMPCEDEKSNKLWRLLVECWALDPQNRPTSLEVMAKMTDLVSGDWLRVGCSCTQSSQGQQDTKTQVASDTIIDRKMSVGQVLSRLYEHGCEDATHLIDQTKYTMYPVSHGGFGDVYSGRLKDGSPIALKCLRLTLDSSDASQKQIRNAAHELYIWSKCDHPNILRLVGVTQHRNQLAMVSPWMEHGSLNNFLSRYPEVDRYRLSAQVADGIAYLHGENIVHGDIKGVSPVSLLLQALSPTPAVSVSKTNILISKDHTPKITDFGTAALGEYTLKFTASATTSRPGMSLRWTTILETITGAVPFFETPNENALVLKIARYEHPKRPDEDMPPNNKKADLVWSLLIACWSHEPKDRPAATKVRDIMRFIASDRTD
ncbi:unnamed protein product [Rhizoctonia solani]|uniref:Protein kinase domain-containing protein n=1 Tax=Rhizoctonia solani TaxID=456999 RepID=A0A8H2WW49_9AGAM|nr:unnamed protein product [Rhizoctonia solani]